MADPVIAEPIPEAACYTVCFGSFAQGQGTPTPSWDYNYRQTGCILKKLEPSFGVCHKKNSVWSQRARICWTGYR